FVHTPTVEEAEANGSMVRDLLTRAFGGSAALMVASLLDSRDVRKKDVAAIKRLIREREDGK
ncbi:BlaI/MecI/CopY family transcriptional regulator, partial [bacterium]|nr:BlaI/MecI/CopY family transcriptional regulator [bacterium]